MFDLRLHRMLHVMFIEHLKISDPYNFLGTDGIQLIQICLLLIIVFSRVIC